jgi:hypothetical protein
MATNALEAAGGQKKISAETAAITLPPLRILDYIERRRLRWRKDNHTERQRAAQRLYRERHPDRVKATAKRYKDSHHDELLEAQRVWRRKNRDYIIAYKRAVYHGLRRPTKHGAAGREKKPTIEYAALELNRIGPCEICGARKMLMFDHDHKTGAFRGWLCRPCNSRLGWFELRNKHIFEYLSRAERGKAN